MSEPLRLIVGFIDAPALSGGKAIALCTEDGEPIGKQISCSVTNDTDGMGQVTASFHIDGESIRFAD